MRWGGDSLIKVGTDVWRVQNLGRAKFPEKNLMPGQITAKNLMTGQVFITFRVPKLNIFSKRSLFHSFIKYNTFFVRNYPKSMGAGRLPNKGRYGCVASAKLRPGKISRKKTNARANNCQKPNDRASFHYF